MRSSPILAALAALAAAALTTACTQDKRVATTIVCQATVEGPTGTIVITLLDTVIVDVFTTTEASDTVADSVGGDPTPCKAALRASGYMVLNAKDSATGNPTQ